MHIEPIRATTTEVRQIDSQHFAVRKNDHDKAVALFAGILNYQKAHPEIYYSPRSRSFFREDPTNPDHEIWMFIDEYDNRAVYWQSLLDAAANDANGAANLAAWQALVVPPPPTGHIVWTEIQELRVQFRFREPLWPGCPDKEDTAQDVPKDAITATPTADTQIDEGSFIIPISVRTDHLRRTKRGRMIMLTPQETIELLKAARKHSTRDWAMILLAYRHGLRASEVCGIKLADVDLKTGSIFIWGLKGWIRGD